MRKTFTLLFSVCIATMLNAQVNPIDFEDAGHGADWTWTVFENDTNPAVEIIDNPDPSGINTSSKVMKFTALQAGQPWAGTESMHGEDIGTFTIDETNSTITLMVWKSVISDVGIKFVKPNGDADVEIKVPNTVTNQWEEITIDYSSRIGSPNATGVDQIVIFPDFNLDGRTQDNIVYVDNISFSAGQSQNEAAPMVAAPTPTESEENVISLFSDAYTDVNVDTWNTTWSVANYEEIMIDNNPTKKYTLLSFNGTEMTSPSVDAATSEMIYFHLDVWSPNSTAFRVKLVDFKGDGYEGGNGDTEAELSFTLNLNEWNSLTIPLQDFMDAGMTDFSDINQFIFSSDPSGESTIYIDNVYFGKEEIIEEEEEPMLAAPTPTLDAADVISLFSDAYTNVNVDTWNTTWSAATYEEIMIENNPTKKYANLDFNGIETTSPSVDASSTGMMYFHLDVWSPNSTDFRIKLVDFKGDGYEGGNGDTEAELSFTLNLNEWNSLDIPLQDFMDAGMTDMSDINQIIFSSDPTGQSTIYLDNVYFAKVSSLETNTYQNLRLTTYPNPSNALWNITAESFITKAELYDVNGRKIFTKNYHNTNSIQLNGDQLSRGIYFATIISSHGSKTIKLIKK